MPKALRAMLTGEGDGNVTCSFSLGNGILQSAVPKSWIALSRVKGFYLKCSGLTQTHGVREIPILQVMVLVRGVGYR